MAARDLSYRRFFDISTLVGLRMENVQVFEATHALTLKWVSEGRLSGLRIDHIDGLRDPIGYLRAAADRRAECLDPCGKDSCGRRAPSRVLANRRNLGLRLSEYRGPAYA